MLETAIVIVSVGGLLAFLAGGLLTVVIGMGGALSEYASRLATQDSLNGRATASH